MFSKEFSIMLACSKINKSDKDIEFIRENLTWDINWDTLTYLCAQHRLIPIVLKTLKDCGKYTTADRYFKKIFESYSYSVSQHNKAAYSIIQMLSESFMKNNIKAVLLKGPLLASTVYRDITLREYNDIDFLVDKKDIKTVTEILIEKGFIQGKFNNDKDTIEPASRSEKISMSMMTNQVYDFKKNIEDLALKYIDVDINFDAIWNGPITDPLTNEFTKEIMEECITYNFNGTTVYGMDYNYHFVYLCCHLYSEAVYFCMHPYWKTSKTDLNLIKFCDIAEIIRQKLIDWAKIKKIIRNKLYAKKALFFALCGLQKLYDDLNIMPLITSIQNENGFDNQIINYFYDSDGQLQKWNMDFVDRMILVKERVIEIVNRGIYKT